MFLLTNEHVESVEAEKTEQALKDDSHAQVANSTSQSLQESAPADKPADESTEVKKTKSSFQSLIPLSKLIEAGVHLGLKPNKWNPKMLDFIYAKKFNHIIDIQKTVKFLKIAYNFLLDIAKTGGKIIFVGTKNKMVCNLIKEAATRVDAFYVTQRWLGGTLTNFKVITNSINRLNELEDLLADEEKKLGRTKKELVLLTKEKEKLMKFYGGIKTMQQLPQVLVCLDPVEDINSILEAKKLNIPVVAVANTNADPSLIDFIIPANNFSVRSSYLLVNALADAIAVANEQDTLVVNKTAEEIVLPEIQRKRRFQRGFNNQSLESGSEVSNSDSEIIETEAEQA